MVPKLVYVDPRAFGCEVLEVALDRLPVVIGRGQQAGICVHDALVCQKHCEIDAVDGKLVVRDLDSKRGTFRNGLRVREAVLLPGDVLTIGKSSFVASYHCESQRTNNADERLQLNQPPLEHLEHLLVEDLKSDGVSGVIIAAFEKTGLLVTEQNEKLISAADLARWDAAVLEYQAQQGWPEELEFPIATVAFYGPNERHTTKIQAVVISSRTGTPILRQWIDSRVKRSRKVEREVRRFLTQHEVKTLFATTGNIGCMHDEGKDFAWGQQCPFCPYWKGKQGIVDKHYHS